MGFLSNDSPGALIANGLMIQTCTNVLPIPVGWGIFPVAPNLFWAADFAYHDNGSGSAGGKGLGGKGGQPYYSASLMFGLCEGEVQGLQAVYVGTSYQIGDDWLSSVSAAFYTGSYPNQSPWDYLTSNYPSQALGYPGQCWVGAANLNLGDSPVPPNYTYVLVGKFTGTAPWQAMSGAPGADIGLIIQDLLTNEQYGVSNFPSGSLNLAQLLSSSAATGAGDAAFQTYCRSLGLTFAPVLQSVEKANSILDRWCQLTNTALCFYDGALQFIPRGDTAVTANGVTFLPDLTPVLALTEDDFHTDDKDDPVKIDRVAPEDVFNVVRVETYNFNNRFAPLPIEARDETAIAAVGMMRIMPTVSGHEIVDPYAVGGLSAQLILQRNLYVLNHYTFSLSWELGVLLTPMDLVTITSPDQCITNLVVRIQKLEEDENGIVKVTAEEFPQGIATAVLYDIEQPAPNPINLAEPPGPVNAPIVFEPYPALVGSTSQVWAAVSGGFGGEQGPYWGSAIVNVSLDGESYTQLPDMIKGPAITGSLVNSLAAFGGTNPDNADTLTVNLNESGGSLSSVSSIVASVGASLCYVDGELIGYTNAALVSITFAVSEEQTVPTAAPYTIDANFVADWTADIGVSYTGGTALTKVSGTPAAGQYAVAAGVYAFAEADAGAAVTPSYDRTGPGYQLTGLYRGMFSTCPDAHAAGTRFAFLGTDPNVLKYDLPSSYIGQTLYLKFQSVNLWGGATQDLEDCTAYTYTPSGAGVTDPILAAMELGTPIDFGTIGETVVYESDWGSIGDCLVNSVDLGTL